MNSDQTTSIILALVAGLPTTLAVILAAWLQARRTTKSEVKIASKVEEVATTAAAVADKQEASLLTTRSDVIDKLSSVAEQTDQVHKMVNSRLSEALAEIERLRQVVEGQRDAIREAGGTPPSSGKSQLGERKENKK